MNARITVVVLTDESGQEKIVASNIWRPPMIPGGTPAPTPEKMLELGLATVLANWGDSTMNVSYFLVDHHVVLLALGCLCTPPKVSLAKCKLNVRSHLLTFTSCLSVSWK